eukprot:1133650-Pyramimonas_sp.AAC.1
MPGGRAAKRSKGRARRRARGRATGLAKGTRYRMCWEQASCWWPGHVKTRSVPARDNHERYPL